MNDESSEHYEIDDQHNEEDKRISILKKIQSLCQDEEVYNQFEKILNDYEEKGSIMCEIYQDKQAGAE